MAEVSIQISSEDAYEKTITTTVTNVNPEANNVLLKQLAMQINALTNNTFKSAVRVTKEGL